MKRMRVKTHGARTRFVKLVASGANRRLVGLNVGGDGGGGKRKRTIA